MGLKRGSCILGHGIPLRVLVRKMGRTNSEIEKQKREKMKENLLTNKKVTKVARLGRQAGFKDTKTSLKHALKLEKETHQEVERLGGVYWVHPDTLTRDEVWNQLKLIQPNQTRGIRGSKPKEHPGSTKAADEAPYRDF